MGVRPMIRRRGRSALVKYCPMCGKANPNHARFCLLCGTKLEVEMVHDDKIVEETKITVVTKSCDICGKECDYKQMKQLKNTSKHGGISFSFVCKRCYRRAVRGKTSRFN